MQAPSGEIRPDLFGAILVRSRSDFQAIRFCQRLRLIGLRFGSKPGQGNDRGSQDSAYCKGRDRFDHVMLLTGGLNPASLGDQLSTIVAGIGSQTTTGKAEVTENVLLSILAWRQAALCRACVISDADHDQGQIGLAPNCNSVLWCNSASTRRELVRSEIHQKANTLRAQVRWRL